LHIGAGARHRDIELSPAVQKHYPLLYETFRKVAQPRIRNMGTVGGNLAAGDPLTDPGASLIALDAEVTLSEQQRSTNAAPWMSFFIDYYQTALEPGELLTEIHVPPPQRSGWSHIKFTPRSVEDLRPLASQLRCKQEWHLRGCPGRAQFRSFHHRARAKGRRSSAWKNHR
jgi:carbon-monoxide dehydrogenase medium subunit